MGLGVDGWNDNFGAPGWVRGSHLYNGQVFSSDMAGNGDFLMDLTPVPEPSALALAATALAGFGFAARRRFAHS